MIAYNRQSLDNLELQVQSMEAFDKKLMPPEEYDRIRAAYPFYFYIPNSFIRIGLFLLTVLATICGLGLLFLMGLGSIEQSWKSILFTSAAICIGALELFIHNRKMYGAGVDDALLWIAVLLVFINLEFWPVTIAPAVKSGIICLLAALSVLRYTDRLMTLVGYGALLCFVFYTVAAWGAVARALLPFLLMILSIGIYLLCTRLSAKHRLRHYQSCLLVLRVTALLSFYGTGNY